MNFEKWNKMINPEEYKKDIREIEENSGNQNYEEVPHGEYEVSIEKLELAETKNGDPKVACWFKVLTGEHKNGIIFMNQVILQPFQIHQANQFLKSLDTNVDVEFTGRYDEYANTIADVFEEASKLAYALEYSQNKKGYNTFKITEVFEF